MDYVLFVKSVLIGFLLSVPIGPVNILCIRRSMLKGRMAGLISGLGAATCDSFFAWVTASGINFITNFYTNEEMWLRLGGGVFLCALGVKSFLYKPVVKKASNGNSGFVSAYVSTFLLTLTNPLTIIAFAAAFAGFGLAGLGGGNFSAAVLVAGVFTGSALWWFILSRISSLLHKRFDIQVITWISRFSGVLIVVFGFLIILKLI